ncbi:hypothetical protein B0H16DRAFT_1788068 [Mycena metata]|uniref:Uncharacterized protein n=1 Tax=Mycena metata TaxID=1033252 RepID=A0AAD7HL59_9AGAR|nr:hypothetical protein B0H16DRAFT_1788068 [Mycena metata]
MSASTHMIPRFPGLGRPRTRCPRPRPRQPATPRPAPLRDAGDVLRTRARPRSRPHSRCSLLVVPQHTLTTLASVYQPRRPTYAKAWLFSEKTILKGPKPLRAASRVINASFPTASSALARCWVHGQNKTSALIRSVKNPSISVPSTSSPSLPPARSPPARPGGTTPARKSCPD